MIRWLLVLVIICLAGCASGPVVQEADGSKFQGITKQVGLNAVRGLEIDENAEWEFVQWRNEHAIYVIERSTTENTLLQYDLYTGDRQPLFTTEGAISSVTYNRLSQSFAIYYSEDPMRSYLMIATLEGEQIRLWETSAYDLFVAWSPFNADQMVVSTFQRDWTADTFLWSIKDDTRVPLQVPSPFLYWLFSDTLTYMDTTALQWNLLSLESLAPEPISKNVLDIKQLGPYTVALERTNEGKKRSLYKQGSFVFSTSLPSGVSRLSPMDLAIQQERMYIVENDMLVVYSLTDGSLIRQLPIQASTEKLTVSPKASWAILHSYNEAYIVRLASGEAKPLY